MSAEAGLVRACIKQWLSFFWAQFCLLALKQWLSNFGHLLLQIRYKQPTPAETPLILRSQVAKMELMSGPGRKATVQVQLTLHKLSLGGKESLLASAEGVYKKLGALRAM